MHVKVSRKPGELFYWSILYFCGSFPPSSRKDRDQGAKRKVPRRFGRGQKAVTF